MYPICFVFVSLIHKIYTQKMLLLRWSFNFLNFHFLNHRCKQLFHIVCTFMQQHILLSTSHILRFITFFIKITNIWNFIGNILEKKRNFLITMEKIVQVIKIDVSLKRNTITRKTNDREMKILVSKTLFLIIFITSLYLYRQSYKCGSD